MYWLKQKKVIFSALAVLFVVVLFLFKSKTTFEKKKESGLVYAGTETLADLVNKDTDGDSIADWEESLWGTDPTKKETVAGLKDDIAIEKLKKEQNRTEVKADYGVPASDEENLTETDKLSRELFSSVATLNQAGEIDQATVDKLTGSLAEHIQNPNTRRVFLISEMKVINDESIQAVKTYSDALNKIYSQNTTGQTVLDVLSKFIVDENNVNESALADLDPIIKKINNMVDGTIKTSVPQSLAPLHLDLVNVLEKLSENVSDIKLFSTDIVVALSGVSQYQTNTDDMQAIASKLANVINQKLKN